MLLKIFLILMILFAIMAVQTHKLRRAVIYLGIFSLISSFCYLLYSAPDVAIAEAIIGSTLSTILYLVALQKYKVFTIYYTDDSCGVIDDVCINKGRERILDLIEQFCISRELEPQVIYTAESLKHLEENHQYDLIVRHEGDQTSVFGNKQNYQFDALRRYIQSKKESDIKFVVYEIEEGD
ncbi:DUF4040 domain-containing protein [Petroclostridium sp. X23]|uniref:Na(+)/H(+) antiporter subunit B n=1 Tax=Petroclostridium sp. X23 TaxID=3045146 RepID=UPI0024AE44A2|nr:DUF4040 domain-containing protein [Petroclostridium sp. X23]WHH57697.1 DUF4040 domain-containing protein [Petroclostridium sp. X23]